MRRHEPSGRMTFPQLQRAVVTTADGLQRVAQSCASDFEQYGTLQQQLQALVVDLSVQVETLKIQIAGILARMDGHRHEWIHDIGTDTDKCSRCELVALGMPDPPVYGCGVKAAE